MKHLLREPLVHFFLLGVILFGTYSYAERAQGGIAQSTQIRLTIDDISQLVLVFRSQWRRDPTPQELRVLVEDRIREVVLYREALALKLDVNDDEVSAVITLLTISFCARPSWAAWVRSILTLSAG